MQNDGNLGTAGRIKTEPADDVKLSHVKTLRQLKRLDQAAKYQNAVRLSQLLGT